MGNTLIKTDPPQGSHLFDLKEFDGPLCSVFQNNEDYLIFDWISSDEQYNYWNKFLIDKKTLISYLKEEVDFRAAIDNSLNKTIQKIAIDNECNSFLINEQTLDQFLRLNPIAGKYKFDRDLIFKENEDLINQFISENKVEN